MFTLTKRRGHGGFTLIELLVVIAIIGILSSVVLASLNSARQKGRDARRISDLKQVQLALELYYDANQSYPSALTEAALVTPGYIAAIPVDPGTQDPYGYDGVDADGTTVCTDSSCDSYVIAATLENASNSVVSNDIDTDFSGGDGPDCTDPTYCVMP
jgi:prepilin-type N-terminal cleavage/methylation domain-containing protein